MSVARAIDDQATVPTRVVRLGGLTSGLCQRHHSSFLSLGLGTTSVILLVAAVLKSIEVGRMIQLQSTTSSVIQTVPVIVFEVAMAWVVFSARHFIATVKISIALFSLFAGFTFFRLAWGYNDCSCFGAMRVHPSLTLGLDVFVVASLFLLSKSYLNSISLGRLVVLLVIAAVSGFAWGFGLHQSREQCVLRIESLLGESLHVPPNVTSLVVYNPNCPSCEWVHQRFTNPASSSRQLITYEDLPQRMWGNASGCVVTGIGVSIVLLEGNIVSSP
jgi:hypothetical protein